MKNSQNKNVFPLDTYCINRAFQRFLKNSLNRKNTLSLDTSDCNSLFHEKLQIIFANIRV
jgi:3-methyladenine DNA glycosylase/8-oxoguanine DNA glycosylase